jgi:hypothetical protein
MPKQVLIINVTRMGDLIQTGPLLSRLREEWPDVAIDLVVDRSFAPTAALLTGLREVISCDFTRLLDECRTQSKSLVTLMSESISPSIARPVYLPPTSARWICGGLQQDPTEAPLCRIPGCPTSLTCIGIDVSTGSTWWTSMPWEGAVPAPFHRCRSQSQPMVKPGQRGFFDLLTGPFISGLPYRQEPAM